MPRRARGDLAVKLTESLHVSDAVEAQRVRVVPLATFHETVAPIVDLCDRVLAKVGERDEIADGSEADYAWRILVALSRTGVGSSREQALKYAWEAARLTFLAHIVFRGKWSAARAASRAADVHAQRARRRRRGVNQWEREIDARRPGRTKDATRRAIAEREGIKPDSVKKQLQRLAKKRKRDAESRGQNRR